MTYRIYISRNGSKFTPTGHTRPAAKYSNRQAHKCVKQQMLDNGEIKTGENVKLRAIKVPA